MQNSPPVQIASGIAPKFPKLICASWRRHCSLSLLSHPLFNPSININWMTAKRPPFVLSRLSLARVSHELIGRTSTHTPSSYRKHVSSVAVAVVATVVLVGSSCFVASSVALVFVLGSLSSAKFLQEISLFLYYYMRIIYLYYAPVQEKPPSNSSIFMANVRFSLFRLMQTTFWYQNW